MNKKTLLTQILVFCLSTFGFCQYVIKLTSNINPKRTVTLEEGMRVRCIINQGSISYTNDLMQIDPRGVVVGDTTIMIADIKAIGKRKKGTYGGAYLLIGIGSALLRTGALGTDSGPPCSNCVVIEENKGLETAGRVLGVTGGLLLTGLGILTLDRNSAKRLHSWKMEILPKENVLDL